MTTKIIIIYSIAPPFRRTENPAPEGARLTQQRKGKPMKQEPERAFQRHAQRYHSTPVGCGQTHL